jgi:hypothetical protein
VSLAEKLLKPENRDRVVADCVTLVDEEVRSKGGLTGLAVKGAYGVVKAVKPKFVAEVVDGMLDEWVAKLEPFYDAWKAEGGKPFADYLKAHGPDAADALLSVTDGRAKVAKSGSVKKMYEKMRPSAKKHVEEALPRLGRLVEKEVGSS